MADDGQHLASLDDEEIVEIEKKKDNPNTKLVIKKSVHAFCEFLAEKGELEEFEASEKGKLDSTLKSFFANARTTKKKLYKLIATNSLGMDW